MHSISSKLMKLYCHTITVNNSKESIKFKDLEAILDTKIHFAHPYSPWERPLIEQTRSIVNSFLKALDSQMS